LATVLETALGAISIWEASHHGGGWCCGAMVCDKVSDGEVILVTDAGYDWTGKLG
jgi:hypothetical protein|tara:strand:- start:205 stop:369 length:165 start_codon:yes stop_codon:yes gene_type:complete